MASSTHGRSNRRRALRAPVHGEVILHADHGVIRGVLENLSLYGLSMLATPATPPEAGDPLDVELDIQGRPRLVVLGRVVRLEPRVGSPGARLAIDFERVPPAAEDVLEDEVVAAYAAAQTRPVVILDGAEDRRARLAEAVRARGMTPLVPRTPLEVVDLLSRQATHADVCLLSGPFAGHDRDQLAAFLVETFPWVRVAAVTRDVGAAADEASARWRDVQDRDWR